MVCHHIAIKPSVTSPCPNGCKPAYTLQVGKVEGSWPLHQVFPCQASVSMVARSAGLGQ